MTENHALGQVVFNINSGNISQSSLFVDNAAINYNAPLIGVAPSISLNTSTSTLSSIVPVGLFTASIVGTGGSLLNVFNSAPVIILSTTNGIIYSSLLSALGGGLLNIRYTIPNMSSNTWLAGSYTTNLQFSVSLLGGSISPKTIPLNLNVAAFINASSSLGSLQLIINSLDYYRTFTIAVSHNITTLTTVPYGTRLKTNATNFTYSNGYSGATAPFTTTSKLKVQMSTPSVGNAVSPTTTFQNLTISGLAVPTANQQSNTIGVSIPPANLKAGFLQQGTYSTVFNYEIFDSQTTAQATTQSLTIPLTVVVNDMNELKVNQTDINLNYNTAGDYANGVFSDVTGHIILSATTPYDIYVKANTATLTNGGNSLPVGVITIAPPPASAGSFTAVSLSTTSQKIISAAAPVVDRSIDVRYAIPATNSSQLLNKAAGTYTTVITYSLIAP